MADQARTLTPHERYYLKDGVTFLVDATLFKVPRYLLETSSPILADLIAAASSHDESMPITLHDVTCADFEHLLAFLYPLSPPSDPLAPSLPFSAPQWIAILRLSTRFRMMAINALAMCLVSTHITDSLTKIKLGREYAYTPWMREGLVRLCLREEMVSVGEAEGLTKEEVVMYAKAREEIKKSVNLIGSERCRLLRANGNVTPSRLSMSGSDDRGDLNDRTVLRIVNDAFGFPHIEDGDATGKGGEQNQLTTHSQYDSPGSLFAMWKLDDHGWCWHWPSDLRRHLPLPSATHLLWLMSPSTSKEEWHRSISRLKTSASMTTVEEMEKYWLWLWGVLRGDLALDLRKYVTPMSVSLALGAVGVLVLIPQFT